MSLSETLAESLTADRVRRGVDAAEEWVATNGPKEMRKPALAVLNVLDDRAEEVALHGSAMVVEGVRMLSMGYEPDLVKLRYIRHHSTPEERRARRDRHVLFGFAFLAAILGLMLAGCSGVHIPDEFRTQVLVNVSSVSADLDAWPELTDEEKRAIVEDFRLFTLDTAKVIELDVPQDLR